MLLPPVLPGEPTRYARDRPVRVVRTLLDVELDFGAKMVTGTATHTIEAISESVDSIEIDAEGMTFRSIIAGGKEAKNEYDDRKLKISLDPALIRGQKLEIKIRYSCKPKRGLYFSGPTEAYPYRSLHVYTHSWPEDSHGWFPCFDYPNMKYSSDTNVTVPAGMTVLSNGTLVSARESDSKKTWHFHQELPHPPYTHSIVAGYLAKVDESYGFPVEYYVPPSKLSEAKSAFSKTIPALEHFSKITGCPYPYAKYSQAATDFPGGGTENVSATTIVDEILLADGLRKDFGHTGDDIVVHELAHQWFGDYLTCKDWSHFWLNEGFATYFTALFREADAGEDDFQYFMYAPYMETFFRETERIQRPIVKREYLDPEEISGHHPYEKGAWVLHGLRGLLGDEAFFRGVRLYVSRHANSNVETFDLREALEEASGVDLEHFFDEWIYSLGYPEYEVTYKQADERIALLTVEQKNAGIEGIPLYSTPIGVKIAFRDGTTVKRKVTLRQKREEFKFSLPGIPINVSFDPENWILKKLKFDKPAEMWLYQLKTDRNVVERIRACLALSELKEDHVDALAYCMYNDTFWGVRFEAAKAIGKAGTGKALEVLFARVNDSDNQVRRGVAHGLRGFAELDERNQNRAIDALVGIVDTDSSLQAKAAAASSLGHYKKSDKALDAIKRALSKASPSDTVRKMALQGLAERNDTATLPLVFDCLGTGKIQGRLEAIKTLAKIGKGGATATLLSLKTSDDPRIRSEAASNLAELKDPSILPELKAWLEAEESGRVRGSLRETIYLLS
jgi:aminopeptidase N